MTPHPVFTWPVRVYWEDTDAGGIVFYANYLKFFERARTEWLRSLGVAQGTLKEEAKGMFVVSETSVRYLSPARLDDELLVTAKVNDWGRASLIIDQQALDAATGKMLWKRYLGGQVVASPITYMADGRQYVSIASGQSLFTFALGEQ